MCIVFILGIYKLLFKNTSLMEMWSHAVPVVCVNTQWKMFKLHRISEQICPSCSMTLFWKCWEPDTERTCFFFFFCLFSCSTCEILLPVRASCCVGNSRVRASPLSHTVSSGGVQCFSWIGSFVRLQWWSYWIIRKGNIHASLLLWPRPLFHVSPHEQAI